MLFILALWGCQDQTFSQHDADIDNVEGAGVLTYSPEILLWTDLEVGNTVGQAVTIDSVGELNLMVYEARIIQSANGQFYMSETEDKTIGPGGSLPIDVVCSLNRDQPIEGVLQIKTNDVDHITFEVPLQAFPLGWTEDTGDTGGDTGDTGGDTGDSGGDTGDSGGEDTGGDTGDTGGEDTGDGGTEDDTGDGGEASP